MRIIAWGGALVAALAAVLPAHAHEKWFVDPGPYPPVIDGGALGRTAIALLAAAAMVGAAGAVDHWWRRRMPPHTPADLARSANDLRHLLAWIPVILAVHAAVPLIVSGVQRRLFVPNLELPPTFVGGLVGLAEIVVALGFLYGMLARGAAAVLVALFPIGVILFGAADMLEHLELLGIALFMFIIGRGPYSFDRLVDVPRPRARSWIPAAVPALRITTGLAIAWLGLTEKLWNLPLGEAFLARYPFFNLTASLGAATLSNAEFIIAAGTVEVTLGLVIASGFLTRPVILAAWVPFNLTLPFLGWVEAIGHLPVYGVMAVLLVWGSGRDVGPYVAELSRQAA